MAKVEVSRGLLIGMATTLGTALLALVFLLGRASGQATPPSAQAGAPAPPSARLLPASSPLLSPAQDPPPSTVSPSAPAIAAAIPSGPSTPAADPARAAVAAYFEAVDHIAPGQLSGDPEAVAQEMVSGLAKGDSSAFDRLIEQSEGARRRLAALSPPAPCAAYHRQSLVDLDESLGLMRSMKKALEGSDAASSLTSLGSRANDLRARSEALQREEKALRQRYGLAR